MDILNRFVSSVFADEGCPGCGMVSDGRFMGAEGYLGMLLIIIFWVLALLAIAYLLKKLFRQEEKRPDRAPLEILKERYAKGEIDKDEFEKRKRDLG